MICADISISVMDLIEKIGLRFFAFEEQHPYLKKEEVNPPRKETYPEECDKLKKYCIYHRR